MRLRNSMDNHHYVKCEYSNVSWNDKQTVGSVDRSLLRHTNLDRYYVVHVCCMCYYVVHKMLHVCTVWFC